MNRVIGLIAACLLPIGAGAAEGDLPYRTSGLYFGLGAGFSQLELDNPPFDISGGDFGYKVFAGYRFRSRFLPWNIQMALEAGWADLGEATENATGAELGLAVDGFEGYGVLFVPLTHHFEFLAKAGVYAWNADLAENGSTQTKNDGTDLALGIGFAYQTGGQLGGQIELESFDFLDGGYLASASITYQFK